MRKVFRFLIHVFGRKTGEKYPMGYSQPAQIDCMVKDCIFYKGGGVCSNVSPAISLNPNKTFVCWSKKDKNEVDNI